MEKRERIEGALWGFLLGDAVGVSYEFNPASSLPSMEELEMKPPSWFSKTYPRVPIGTWSDDGAHVLCLLDSLLEKGKLDLDHLASVLLAWYQEGKWAVDRVVFDFGIQTSASLRAYAQGVPPEKSGFVNPDGKGNGSLMRVLPLALWHTGSNEELVSDAHRQSLPTHGHILNQVCCALYALWVREVLSGLDISEAYQRAVAHLRSIYASAPEYREQLESHVRPEEEPVSNGDGYVVTTMHSVRIATRETNFKRVVQKAISLGNDTDTNAAIAGGLMGAKVGKSGLPSEWMEQLRGKELVHSLLDRWEQVNL